MNSLWKKDHMDFQKSAIPVKNFHDSMLEANYSKGQILDKKKESVRKARKQQRRELEEQHWYHGLLSREDIELDLFFG